MVMEQPALRIKDLSFRYPGQDKNSLTKVNFEIAQGERFGLFGPNGAGKTTLIHLMTGLLDIEEGSIELLGHQMKHHERSINHLFGFVPQDFSFYEELSPVENLDFFGAWAGLNRPQIKKRKEELLEVLGLANVRNKQVGKFSGGMKRRVNLAIAVIHEPRVLFLDEPTVGVDVQTRHAIIDYLKELNSKGTTLIYTSHQLKEAESLCENIVMMDEGQVIVHDSLQQLLVTHHEKGLEGLFLHLTGKAYRDHV